MVSMAGASRLTRFGVNAIETRRRYRVCAGGSTVSIVGTFGQPSAITDFSRSSRSGDGFAAGDPNLEENVVGSWRIRLTSAWRDTAKIRSPARPKGAPSSSRTGARSRISR